MSQTETTAKEDTLAGFLNSVSPKKGKDKQEKMSQTKTKAKKDMTTEPEEVMSPVRTLQIENPPLLENHNNSDVSKDDSILGEIEKSTQFGKEHKDTVVNALELQLQIQVKALKKALSKRRQLKGEGASLNEIEKQRQLAKKLLEKRDNG